jgi:hypothetical protein
MTQSKPRLPDKVTLGYSTVNLKLLDSKISRDVGEQFGCYISTIPYTVYLDQEIIDLGGPDAVNLVLHELNHHIYYINQLEEGNSEELVVNSFANDITELFYRSELRDWLFYHLDFGRKI